MESASFDPRSKLRRANTPSKNGIKIQLDGLICVFSNLLILWSWGTSPFSDSFSDSFFDTFSAFITISSSATSGVLLFKLLELSSWAFSSDATDFSFGSSPSINNEILLIKTAYLFFLLEIAYWCFHLQILWHPHYYLWRLSEWSPGCLNINVGLYFQYSD